MISRKVPLMGTGLGSRIKTAREMAGLTQPELGARIGVGRSAVAKYEREELGVSLEGLKRISEATECNLAWLIGESEAPPSVTSLTPDVKLALSIVVQVVEEADLLRSELAEAKAENERLRKMLDVTPVPKGSRQVKGAGSRNMDKGNNKQTG